MNGQDSVISISGALRRGWELFKENVGFLLVYQLILYALTAFMAATYAKPIWHFLLWLLFVIAKMGFYNSAILIAEGVKPEFDQLYSNWRSLLSWIIANLLFAIMFTLGLILLIVPGLYIWARYGLFPYFILDRNLGPIAALEQTGLATRGIRWDLFLLLISCLLLNLLGLLLLGIGIFVTAPVTMLAVATVYHQIKNRVATP